MNSTIKSETHAWKKMNEILVNGLKQRLADLTESRPVDGSGINLLWSAFCAANSLHEN